MSSTATENVHRISVGNLVVQNSRENQNHLGDVEGNEEGKGKRQETRKAGGIDGKRMPKSTLRVDQKNNGGKRRGATKKPELIGWKEEINVIPRSVLHEKNFNSHNRHIDVTRRGSEFIQKK